MPTSSLGSRVPRFSLYRPDLVYRLTVAPNDFIGPDPKNVWPPDERVATWIDWLKGDLYQAVLGLERSFAVWTHYNGLLDVMKEEAKTPGLVHSWITTNYVSETAISIRRILDRDSRTVSMIRLLEEMVEHPHLVQRELWVGRRRGLLSADALDAAWGDWGGDVVKHLDPQVPLRDRCTLLTETGTLKTYVDKHVAHLDANRSEFETSVTFAEVSTTIGLISTIFRRYYSFLAEAELGDPPPSNAWQAVFKYPWDPK